MFKSLWRTDTVQLNGQHDCVTDVQLNYLSFGAGSKGADKSIDEIFGAGSFTAWCSSAWLVLETLLGPSHTEGTRSGVSPETCP